MYKGNDNFKSSALTVRVNYTSDDPEQRTKDLEKALSKFKKMVHKEGIIQQMKEREYFKSPGRKRYEKRKDFKYKMFLQKLKRERNVTRSDRVHRKRKNKGNKKYGRKKEN